MDEEDTDYQSRNRIDFDPDFDFDFDFVEAQTLWDDSRSFSFHAKSDDEPRFAMVAELNEKLWVAFYTIREDRVRIISVRRARKGEEILYES